MSPEMTAVYHIIDKATSYPYKDGGLIIHMNSTCGRMEKQGRLVSDQHLVVKYDRLHRKTYLYFLDRLLCRILLYRVEICSLPPTYVGYPQAKYASAVNTATYMFATTIPPDITLLPLCMSVLQ